VFFSHELDNISPYGKLVDVNGQKMHVYSMGNGKKTIVLLSGFGVPLPSADFAPLMRELSKEYTVVCIEYFGIGFSNQTEVPRTNANYVEEIRIALKLAGFNAPYILMPHSGSGIYSEYYATKYAEEVSAIIMLDTTSSAKTETNVPKFVYSLGKVQQTIGLARLYNPIVVSSVLSINKENGYTKKEADDYTKFLYHSYNDTVIDQLLRLSKNIEEVMNMSFPCKVPVLKIVASETAQGKQTGEEYQNAHINRLGANAQWITMKGNHFIYHGNATAIRNATDSFCLDNEID
jgi:pimeloyl-ACP methyl ester carboxylesterase